MRAVPLAGFLYTCECCSLTTHHRHVAFFFFFFFFFPFPPFPPFPPFLVLCDCAEPFVPTHLHIASLVDVYSALNSMINHKFIMPGMKNLLTTLEPFLSAVRGNTRTSTHSLTRSHTHKHIHCLTRSHTHKHIHCLAPSFFLSVVCAWPRSVPTTKSGSRSTTSVQTSAPTASSFTSHMYVQCN